MKNIIEFLNGFNTDLDLSYQYEDNMTFDEFEERINECINEAEIIYYHKAIDYLKENDNSLFESLSIAYEYGYDCENLNSEILATLLYQQNLNIQWSDFRDEIEQYFEDNNN
tara:strand:+ start:109 stop:444 length:336 start_codon:yes stop_codon:yes gene_type:complete